MAALKTAIDSDDVKRFLDSVGDDKRRADGLAVLELMREVTGLQPALWRGSIVGFGSYHYRYDSGREGDWFLTGFSPRKQALSLYIIDGFDQYQQLLAALGKYRTGKSCLYVNRLEDIDLPVLRKLVRQSVAALKKKYRA